MEIKIDQSELKQLNEKIIQLAKTFKGEIGEWFDALGIEFLGIVQDEIIRKGVVDTRLLLNSFSKGDANNLWEVGAGGLTLEIASNLEYSKFVNDGHMQHKRWLPGIWSGDKFIYDASSNQGMMLTEKFIEGYHYWESADLLFQRIFEKSLEKKLDEFILKALDM